MVFGIRSISKKLLLLASLYTVSKIGSILYTYVSDLYRYGHLPTPLNVPFFGSVRLIREFTKKGNLNTYKIFGQLNTKFPNDPFWIFWRGLSPMFMIKSPELLSHILTSTTMLGKDYDDLKSWIGNGLVFSKGDIWAYRRKLLTSAFHLEKVKSFGPQIHECVEATIEEIKILYLEKGEFDFLELITKHVFNNILETQMRLDAISISQIKDGQREAYFESLKVLLRNESEKRRNPFCRIPLIKYFTKPIRLERHYHKTFVGMARLMVELKFRQRNRELDEKVKIEDNRLGVLDLLIKDMENPKSKTTIDDIIDELNTFLFAGFDTSSTSLTWVIYLLATHRNEQGDFCTLDDLNSLQYLDAVIKESIRLYPPVSIIMRKDNELYLPVNNKTIYLRPGVSIAICIGFVHRDTKIWGADANLFDPERFLNASRDPRSQNPFCFIPFSAGPRNCIGQRYAYFVMKYFLVHLLLNFDFKTTAEDKTMEFVNYGTLQPEGGLPITVEHL